MYMCCSKKIFWTNDDTNDRIGFFVFLCLNGFFNFAV